MPGFELPLEFAANKDLADQSCARSKKEQQRNFFQ
jgi:hypothetical protein